MSALSQGMDPTAALQTARLSVSSGVAADEVGGSVLRILHQVAERGSAVESLSMASPPLVPALQGCLRWGVAGSLLALETLQRCLSAVNPARDNVVAQALRFGFVAQLLTSLETQQTLQQTSTAENAGAPKVPVATREEAAAERVLIISILQLMAQEGPYTTQVDELLHASPVWNTLRDQRHDMYMPSGSHEAGASGVVGLLTGGASATFALPAPPTSSAPRLESGQL